MFSQSEGLCGFFNTVMKTVHLGREEDSSRGEHTATAVVKGFVCLLSKLILRELPGTTQLKLPFFAIENKGACL